VPERKPRSGTILDFGLPWRDVIGALCGLCYVSAPGSLPGGMENRSGPGIADFGLKKVIAISWEYATF